MTEIQYVKGDATDPQTKDQRFVVHIVNNIGAWGAGFVMAVSGKWPETRGIYKKHYHEYKLGDVQLVPVDLGITVANLFGQDGLRGRGGKKPIRYGAVRRGLKWLAQELKKATFPCSVHMPRIGCGLAGGEWSEIEPIVKETLIAAGIQVFVYDLSPKRLSSRRTVRSYDPKTFTYPPEPECQREWDELEGNSDED